MDNDIVLKIFESFDKDKDGKISGAELTDCLGALGVKISSKEAQQAIEEIDKDGDGQIQFEDFKAFYENTLETDVPENAESGIKDAFDLYDLDKDGFLSSNELHVVMNKLGVKCSVSECFNMVKQVDLDGDGFVSFEEFKLMMFNKH